MPLLLPGAALAQQSPDRLHEVDDDDTTLTYRGLTADELDDMDVVNGAGEKIGEIDEVLADASNQIVAVVVELDAGLLDLDDREVVMGLDQLELEQGDAADFVTSLSMEELEALPIWED